MSNPTIYHNPRCSKSRQSLELLRTHAPNPVIISYLQTPPTAKQLSALLYKLDLSAEQICRKGEPLYKELKIKQRQLSNDDLVNELCANPILIERPIIVLGDKAVIGRPPENVHSLYS